MHAKLELKENDAECPRVTVIAGVTLSVLWVEFIKQLFRCEEAWCATCYFIFAIEVSSLTSQHTGETQINDFDVEFFIEHQIGWFEVTMCKVLLVHDLKGCNEVLRYLPY